MSFLLEFNLQKAVQAMNLFAQREGSSISKVKLLKLLYLADRYHLRRFGRPILNDVYWAMKWGPVASVAKDIASFSAGQLAPEENEYVTRFLQVGGSPHSIVSSQDVDLTVFSDSEREALDFAYEQFGHLSTWKLSDLTHAYPEWEKHKSTLEAGPVTRVRMSYRDFFNAESPVADDKFSEPSDVLDAARDLFEEERELAEQWR